MTRVNAVGYYGWDNFGDELFRAAVQHSRELLWGESARVRFFVTPVRALHQDLGPLGSVVRLLEMALGALWAERVALCGGSVLEDVRGTQRVRDLLARRGQSVEALGVSLGPWDSRAARDRVRTYAEKMERVVVRDQASSDRIGMGVKVGGDLAALYPMPIVQHAERTHLTICVSNDSRASITDLASLFGSLLPGVELPVKILALNVRKTRGDVEISRELKERLRPFHSDLEVLEFESIDQTIGVLCRSRAVWSQRLHGLIVAYLCDVPILALSHHQKISDFAAHVGLPDRLVLRALAVDDDVRAAAAETLSGGVSAALSSSSYRAAVAAAMSSEPSSD